MASPPVRLKSILLDWRSILNSRIRQRKEPALDPAKDLLFYPPTQKTTGFARGAPFAPFPPHREPRKKRGEYRALTKLSDKVNISLV